MASVIFLGFSVFMFLVTYGLLFLIMPVIFGAIFTSLEASPFLGNATDPEWFAIYEENKETVQYMTPLMMTLGIFLLVIKVLMAASSKGAD